MANNYSQFAAEFPFPEAAAQDFLALVNYAQREEGELPSWFLDRHKLSPPSDEAAAEALSFFLDSEELLWLELDAEYSTERKTLYVAAQESGNAYATAWLLSEVMAQHGIKNPVVISAAFTCSKMRPDEFGGEVCVAGQGIVLCESTASMGKSLIARMEANRIQADTPQVFRQSDVAGMRCPQCGSKGPFNIKAETLCTIHDANVMVREAFTWRSDAFCQCCSCNHAEDAGAFNPN